MTRIVLIRHGQTEWNRVERFRGRADIPLNETGLSQADATGERVAAEWRPAAVYSSSLSRAVKTAEAIAERMGLAVATHPGLLDIDYGEWQGLTPEEAKERWPEQIEAWFTRPGEARIPGGETLDDLRGRVMPAVEELADRHAGQTIVLVGHTVVNRMILLGALGLDNERFWRLRQEPCALNVLEWDGADFVLVLMNDTCHLRSLG